MADLDQLAVNTIRMLSVDMVEKAKSGHPGLPLDGTPMAYTLYARFMKHNPADPAWKNRDRFVLSAGHGSAMLYSILHLFGYGVSMDDLRRFRQLGSITPGHPEHGLTPGVEATTGPLGQGFAMGVGMAVAEKALADCFNTDEHAIVDHHTYGFVSDGDLMEGVTSEAASLAGHLRLGKLIYLYADNHISLEGPTEVSFTEDVKRRFDSYGWHTVSVPDGNDLQALTKAVEEAKAETGRPSLVIVRTHIGYGSPKADSEKAHGEPLGAEAVKATRAFFGWPEIDFHVPPEVAGHFEELKKRGAEKQAEWEALWKDYEKKNPENAALFLRYHSGEIDARLCKALPVYPADAKPLATRVASSEAMQVVEHYVSQLIGGSADLNPSTKTYLAGIPDFGLANVCSRNIHYGVREHAMGAITNGIALHGGLLPYSATFFGFYDYMKPPVRLAALMKLRSIFVFTHDSIALGEDGPTHQPVEQLANARSVPGLTVIRPADGNETSAAWLLAVTRQTPTVLVLSRQNLPVLDPSKGVFDGTARGAYVLEDCAGKPDLLLIATGSEVHPAREAWKLLTDAGIRARLVSMPSMEIFAEQDDAYRKSVLPTDVKKRLAVEAAHPMSWWKLVGSEGDVIGMTTFGESAPGDAVLKHFGFTAENIAARARALLG